MKTVPITLVVARCERCSRSTYKNDMPRGFS